MTVCFGWLTRDLKETERLGREIGGCLEPGDTLVLTGDLGAGKTTLTRSIAGALGIDDVSSPSFAIVHEYELPGSPGFFVHADLYRLGEGADISETGLEEYVREGGNIVVVEWGNLLYDAFVGSRCVEISISYDDSCESCRIFRMRVDDGIAHRFEQADLQELSMDHD